MSVNLKAVNLFESSLERVARVLSSTWDVNVVFETDKVCTDGRTVYLPVLAKDAPKELLEAVHGYLDHEVSHVVHTDFEELKKIKNSYLQTIINALEDPRIEKLWMNIYPGSVVNFNNSLSYNLDRIFKVGEDGLVNFDKLSEFNKLLFAGVIDACTNFNDKHWFWSKIPDQLKDDAVKYRKYYKRALNAANTGVVVEIAKEFLAELGLPTDDDIVEHTKNSIGKAGDNKYSASDKQLKADSDLLNFSKSLQADVKDAHTSHQPAQSAPSNYESVADNLDYRIYSTAWDKIEKMRIGNASDYGKFLNSVAATTNVLRNKLARVLLSSKEDRWEGDKLRGKLNKRRVYQVALGTGTRVFKQKVVSPAFDTCVLMMVDHSGSMAGSRLDLAAQTSVIFGEVLDRLGIPFAVYGFSADWDYSRPQVNDASQYARVGNLWLGEYKNWDAPWKQAGKSVFMMARNQKNNTYDGETLRIGARMLLDRPEARKVLFWLNDGEPCPTGVDKHDEHVSYAKRSAKDVEKYVELIAVGIQTDSVKNFYSNYVVVNNINDLPSTCLNKLSSLLIK